MTVSLFCIIPRKDSGVKMYRYKRNTGTNTNTVVDSIVGEGEGTVGQTNTQIQG